MKLHICCINYIWDVLLSDLDLLLETELLYQLISHKTLFRSNVLTVLNTKWNYFYPQQKHIYTYHHQWINTDTLINLFHLLWKQSQAFNSIHYLNPFC